MAHPTLEMLLDQDEAPTAELGAHLATCPQCSSELRLLRVRREALKALPLLPLPPGLTLGRPPARARRQRVAARLVRLAAVAAFAAVALWTVARSRTDEGSVITVATLIGRSQALEADLRAVPEPSVVDVEEADARAEVEDEIAWVDECLAELDASAGDSERAALWKTRISLLESLLKLRRQPTALVSL